jgi:hypothetical protein
MLPSIRVVFADEPPERRRGLSVYHDERCVMQAQQSLPEYLGVRHILTAPQLARRTAPYIGEHDFDFAGLYAEATTMSGGEQLLVWIAGDLWKASGDVKLCDVVRRLDRANFLRVLEGFRLARGSFAWDLVEAFVGGEKELAA